MKRVRAFVGADAEKRAEIVGNYFKALAGSLQARDFCISNGIALTKASTESVDSAGGFLVPQAFDAEILRILELVGAFRQGADVRPTTSDNMIRPRRVGGVTAFWTAEGATITESSFQLDAVETNQKKLAILTRSSAELWEDSAPDLGQFLTQEIAYAFAGTEDDCGFNGDGTSVYRGMSGLTLRLTGMKSSIAAAAGHNTWLTCDATDLGNVVAGVMASALDGSAWYCHPLAYGQLFTRLGAVSGGLTTALDADGDIAATFLGFPIRFSSKLLDGSSSMVGKPLLYFGDLSMSSMIVERRQTVVAVSRQRALEFDEVLLRGTERIDINNHSTGSATERGPVSMLLGTT